MKLSWIIVFSIVAAFASAYDYSDVVKCKCMRLTRCEILWSNLKTTKRKSFIHHYIYTRYLKTVNCGYEAFMPLVCCPDRDLYDTSEILIDSQGSSITLNTQKFVHESSKPTKELPTYSPDSITILPSSSTIPHSSTEPSPSSTTIHSNTSAKPKEENAFAECGRDINRDHHFGNLTELSDFPWLALLEYDTPKGKEFLCGGVLISDQYVLTAAHCVTSRANNLTGVRLGEYDTSTSTDCVEDGLLENSETCVDNSLKVDVDRTIVYPGYADDIAHREDSPSSNDLALVKLKEKVKLSYYVQAICLPLKRPMKQKYLVAGWSRSLIPNASGHERKLMSRLTEIELEACMNHDLLPFVGKEHICAGARKPIERACVADAGGPLMGYEKREDGSVRLSVVGVSYMDLACDRSDLPGVYTRVFEYMPWILEHISN